MTEQLHFRFSLWCIGEGNGNPVQCSCLENPRDGGAWWAAVSGVAQSRTQLKRLSSSNSNSLKVNTLPPLFLSTWFEAIFRRPPVWYAGTSLSGVFVFKQIYSCTGEGNGNGLQCSCLENPRDGGAWWASVYGVTRRRTGLKRLSSSSSKGAFGPIQFQNFLLLMSLL